MNHALSIAKSAVCAAVASVAVIGMVLFPLLAGAADFPLKPVRIIISMSADGPADIFARLIAPALSERWKVPVIVENKRAGSGVIGASAVLNAPPDGSTLLFTITMHI